MISSELLVGDPAPELRLGEVLKGEVDPQRLSRRVRVIEAWSRGCQPCVAAIPHLTALQARYADVPIVGVAVRETDMDALRAFVAVRGAQMAYTVATDAVVDGAGWLRNHWLTPAYAPGIPTAFIVDREDRIAWMGRPTDLDAPLAAVVAGAWDIDAAARRHEEELTRSSARETAALQSAVAERRAGGDALGALQAYDEAFARHPALEEKHGGERLAALIAHDRRAGQDYGHRLAAEYGAANSHIPLGIVDVFLGAAGPAGDDPLLVDDARALLEASEAAIGEDEHPVFEVWREKLFARLWLAKGDAGQAKVRLDAASRRAIAADMADPELADLQGMIDRLGEARGPRRSRSAAVCVGDVCRLDDGQPGDAEPRNLS